MKQITLTNDPYNKGCGYDQQISVHKPPPPQKKKN